MTRDEYYNSLYLAHHGIKGQKWGIRRYQNEDGTYTDEGAKRRRSDSKSGMSDGTKKALKVGAAVAGGALAAIGAYKLHQYLGTSVKMPSWKVDDTLSKTQEYSKLWKKYKPKTSDVVKDKISALVEKAGPVVKEKLKDTGKSAGKFAAETIRDAGKAAAAGALAAVGTIGVNKIAERYKDKPGDSESKKNANLIKREAATSAVNKVTGSAINRVSGQNNGSGNQRSASGKEFTEKLHSMVGTPARKHEWSGEYQTRYEKLMNGPLRDNPTLKADIKAMRHLEYSIDQLEEYVRKGG